MATTIITRPGYEKLQQELDHLRTVKRKEIAELLHEAREGDDFEDEFDAGYFSAKQEQAFLEGRIMELEILLSNPVVVEDTDCEGVVKIGATVTISEDGGQPEAFRIVGPAEASPGEGRISYESPLGRALMSRCPGDEVVVKAPSGNYTVHILKVE